MADLPEPQQATFVPFVTLDTTVEGELPSVVEVAGKVIALPFTIGGKGDVEAVVGLGAVEAEIKQVLGVEAASSGTLGELEWDPARGSLVHRLRHMVDTPQSRQLARTYIANALVQYVKSADVVGVNIQSIEVSATPNSNSASLTGRALLVRVRYRPNGTSTVETFETEVT